MATDLHRTQFSGGNAQTNKYLKDRGFTIVRLPHAVWWVNQGETYSEASQRGDIWAPTLDRAGREQGHWNRVREVQDGDLLIHYSDGAIRALGIAGGNASDRSNPSKQDNLWAQDGWGTDVQYYSLPQALPIGKLGEEVVSLIQEIPDGPLTRTGGVKQGYLWRFTTEAFQAFASAPEFPWPTDIPIARPIKEANQDVKSNLSSSASINDKTPRGGAPAVSLWAQLRSHQLSFGPALVQEYVLALQLRRFVVLSGISGTGKTQLALTVATHYAGIEDVVAAYQLNPTHKGWDLPAALRHRLPPLQSGSPITISIAYPGGVATCRLGVEGARPTVHIFGMEAPFLEWFRQTFQENDPFFWHVVSANDGVRLWIQPIRPWLTLSVSPDWTDHRALLGYYNPILGQYVTTPLLTLLLHAHTVWQQSKQRGVESPPFFVILDEMNLARVEYYFADFLSSLESGEPIRLHAGEVPDVQHIPSLLTIPPNVFFTGTVNVDETTSMLSPKVLDRAYVLQLNTVDLANYGQEVDAEEARPDPTLGVQRAPRQEDWQWLRQVEGGIVTQAIIELNAVFAIERRPFGYRVANELARIVRLAKDHSDWSTWEALDRAIVCKVLPKLHGTQGELHPLLQALFAFAVGTVEDPEAAALEAWELSPQGVRHRADATLRPRFARMATELLRMEVRLRNTGFAAFIE